MSGPGRTETAGTGGSFLPGLNYVPGTTALHEMHPALKLWILLFFSLAVFTFPRLPAALALTVLLFAAYRMAGLGFAFFLKKLRFFLVFGTMIMLVQVLAVKSGALLGVLDAGWLRIEFWSEGLLGGAAISLRFLNVVGSSYLFISTTDPNRLAYALMQMGLPYRAGFMLVTALRFIPVFQLELSQVRHAQMAKGIDLEKLTLPKLITAVRYLLVPLVISALGKVDALSISMESRAFGLYRERSYLERQPFTRRDVFFAMLVPCVFLCLLWFAR